MEWTGALECSSLGGGGGLHDVVLLNKAERDLYTKKSVLFLFDLVCTAGIMVFCQYISVGV